MAIMIPGYESMDGFNGSAGEKILYEKLSELPDSYYVFHSARWNEQIRRERYGIRSPLYVEWREADFVIFLLTRGILFVEVKDGLISYTREGNWQQTNRKNGAVKIIDPMLQAQKSLFFFRDLIKSRYGEDNPYYNQVGAAVWFTAADKSCIQGALPNNYPDEMVLWASDMVSKEQIQHALSRAMDYNGMKVEHADETLTQKMLDLLSPEFGVFASPTTTRTAKSALFHRMTKEQQFLLDYLEEQEEAAIHGCAGTGKTCLAVEKAKRLATEAPTLFLCFNSFLRDQLRKDHARENLTIDNLDSLYQHKTGKRLEYGTMTSEEKDDLLSEFLMEWQENGIQYKNIIVDEGQDFCGDHLRLLHDIALEQKGVFYVFYDRNQFVQGQAYPKWLEEMDCKLVLNRNCRNTREIAITSTRPIGIKEEKIKTRYDNENIASIKPRLFLPNDKEALKDLLDALINAYAAIKIPKDKIVILTVNGESNSILTPDDYILSAENQLSASPEKGKVWFTTVRKFKGLEAEAVICIDLDAEHFTDSGKKNAIYVGTSRAQIFLDLIAVVPDNDALTELAEAVCGTKAGNAVKARTMMANALKVKIASNAAIENAM